MTIDSSHESVSSKICKFVFWNLKFMFAQDNIIYFKLASVPDILVYGIIFPIREQWHTVFVSLPAPNITVAGK